MTDFEVPSWVQDAVFYLIFPDRFAKSSRLRRRPNMEEWDSPPTSHGFKGGDLYGIAERLDYLQDLGVTVILLNPIFTSAANHRYHTVDYFSVDPLLGGTAAFRELLDAAHARDMRIVLDGVFNHSGRGLYQFLHTIENGPASPFLDWFHFNPLWIKAKRQINAYPPRGTQVDTGEPDLALEAYGYKAWWNLPALPKFNTSNPEVRAFIFSVVRFWLEFGIDGWRLDVPGEINDDSFWREFRHVVKSVNPEAYIVGEIWDEASHWLRGDQFDGVMNYMLTKALVGYLPNMAFDKEEIARSGCYKEVRQLNDTEFGARLRALFSSYPEEITLSQLNLLDSHDTPRFLTCAHNDMQALMLATLCLFTLPGAPCIYYGDEIGLTGGADPECRRAFPWDEGHWNFEVRSFFRRFVELRRAAPALRAGRFRQLYAHDGVYAFLRSLDDSCICVIINTTTSEKRVALPLGDDCASQSFEDWWTGKAYAVINNHVRDIFVEPRNGLVLRAG